MLAFFVHVKNIIVTFSLKNSSALEQTGVKRNRKGRNPLLSL